MGGPVENEMRIEVEVRNVYGQPKIYPVNEAAHAAALLINAKTFNESQLALLAKLGHEVAEVVAPKLAPRKYDPAVTPKRLNVGDWAYNNLDGHNVRVVSVTWDEGLNNYWGGWRYNVPGYSTPDLYPEQPEMPYRQYRQVAGRSHCWEPVGPCDRNAVNIPLEVMA